ncbi:hypothetical protein ACJH6J_29920 [Mycobacterium sp. SMC-18]|uniref:hypothetical protein n=1 Tax=Mycobacterium TaxID=1763 RepID=UPI0015E22DD1|nr:hypothetical protein [Mycobacterium kansasii]
MTASPSQGRIPPITSAASAPVITEWRLQLLAGYLPPLMAVAVTAVVHWASARTS